MKTSRFLIKNREALQEEGHMRPLTQHLLKVATSSDMITRLSGKGEQVLHEAGWIVFKGADDSGFAVQKPPATCIDSSLQDALHFVRSARAIVQSFGGAKAFQLELSLDESPPLSWRAFEVCGVAGTIRCAAAPLMTGLSLSGVTDAAVPLIRAKLVGALRGSTEVEVGDVVACEDMDLSLPELEINGRCVWEGGAMTMVVNSSDDVGEQQVPGVRLDLGEIEVRLSDLVGLRPGAVINLGEIALERCFVRVGATVLAEGTFSSCNGELLLTIESVI